MQVNTWYSILPLNANEYVLRFDYLFEQELGTLNVALSGTTLDSIVSDGITGEFQTYSIPVDDPNLIGIHDANLQFIFDGPESGLKLLLDNVGAPNPAPEPGDFNIDNIVNAGDLAIWQTGFGLVADANIYNGDADEDGDVDGIDFLFWQQQAGNNPSSNSLSQAVPEPSTAYCAILFGMSLWGVIMLSKQP